MGCPANIKKFWIFKYEGPHYGKIVKIGAEVVSEFDVVFECNECGIRWKKLLTARDLVDRGFDPKKLYSFGYGYATDIESLKKEKDD